MICKDALTMGTAVANPKTSSPAYHLHFASETACGIEHQEAWPVGALLPQNSHLHSHGRQECLLQHTPSHLLNMELSLHHHRQAGGVGRELLPPEGITLQLMTTGWGKKERQEGADLNQFPLHIVHQEQRRMAVMMRAASGSA